MESPETPRIARNKLRAALRADALFRQKSAALRADAGLSLNVSRHPSGQTYLISAASSENLGDVMRRHNFLNDDQVKIYFAGQEMQVDQNKTLAEFGIVDGSTIILVVVVCNGSSCAY